MRGVELGLTGQDLMLYQMGEVVQIGVKIERLLHNWIDDALRDVGAEHDAGPNPNPRALPLKARIDLAKRLVKKLPGFSDEERAWIQEAFVDTLRAMQERHRVIHDEWVSFGDGSVTRFGYLAAHDGFPATEIEPGIGPGQFSHQDWEHLRTLMWHCYWRLANLTWIRRFPPDFDYFFGGTDAFYAMIRGEFYLGRDFLVPWSWSDHPPDFSEELPTLEVTAESTG